MITEFQKDILVRAMQIRKRRGENVELVLDRYANISSEERSNILLNVERQEMDKGEKE